MAKREKAIRDQQVAFKSEKAQFEKDWYWTSDEMQDDTGDEDDASYAWGCNFNDGYQGYSDKSYAGGARAVRLIHLEG